MMHTRVTGIDLCCIQTTTPSVPNYVAYNFWSKSNFIKFDEVFSKIYNLLQYQINFI
jgi:hypothetical protein